MGVPRTTSTVSDLQKDSQNLVYSGAQDKGVSQLKGTEQSVVGKTRRVNAGENHTRVFFHWSHIYLNSLLMNCDNTCEMLSQGEAQFIV